MKHIVKRNSDKKCESKIRICKEGRVDCIDGVITIVWEDCYADPDAVPPPVTPEVIANIRESNKRPELQWEKRRIRIRKKSKDGWEWTDYIDLQRDASTVAGLNVWRDGAIKYPSKYELIVDEMYQALHYCPHFILTWNGRRNGRKFRAISNLWSITWKNTMRASTGRSLKSSIRRAHSETLRH
jgi:hypothetical protein